MNLLTREELDLGYTVRGFTWAYKVTFPPNKDYAFVLGSLTRGLSLMKDGDTWTIRLFGHGFIYCPDVVCPDRPFPIIAF